MELKGLPAVDAVYTRMDEKGPYWTALAKMLPPIVFVTQRACLTRMTWPTFVRYQLKAKQQRG